MQIDESEDLYATILRAGALRKQGNRLHSQAETLENVARLKFEEQGNSIHAVAQTPGHTLVVAYGGPANERTTRVPYDRLASLSLIGPAPAGSVAMTHAYEPAIIVRLQNFVVGALAVPKGRVPEFYEQLRDEPGPDPKQASLAIARMLSLSIGFNPEMVVDLIRSVEAGARAVDIEGSNVAMFLQVGVPQ